MTEQEVIVTKRQIKISTKSTMKKEEMSIEDLPGVGAATAEKLRNVGYDNLMSIAVATPGEIIEASGMTEAATKKIIHTARTNLDMGFQTGIDILNKRENIKRISSSMSTKDAMNSTLNRRYHAFPFRSSIVLFIIYSDSNFS